MINALTRIRLEQQRDALVEQLHRLGNLMRGTLIQARVKCGRKGCECEKGEKHEKIHLCLNLHGRTRNLYIGQGRKESVAILVREYQRARRIIDELTEINLELLRGDHPGGQQRSGKR